MERWTEWKKRAWLGNAPRPNWSWAAGQGVARLGGRNRPPLSYDGDTKERESDLPCLLSSREGCFEPGSSVRAVLVRPKGRMHSFLKNNREELIARCKTAVARRPKRVATELQLRNGIPLFLDQLTRTLEAEETGDSAALSQQISGLAGGDLALSEIGVSA